MNEKAVILAALRHSGDGLPAPALLRAHAADASDTRLRVGLTISGASAFAAPQSWRTSAGCRTGYTVGTDQTAPRSPAAQLDHEQCS